MDNEIIYSKKYPREDYEAILKEVETRPEEEHRKAREYIDQLAARYTFKPRPGIDNKVKKFIELAQQYSEQYRVDMTIRREPYSISVEMLMDYGPYFGFVKHGFDRLNQLADTITFMEPKAGSEGITVYLDLNTHDKYRDGEIVKWE